MAKFIGQSVELMDISVGVQKHIEKCARTCYKSEDKITDTSANKMIRSLRKSGHTSTFEHYRVCVRVPQPIYEFLYSELPDKNKIFFKFAKGLISANIRAWYEAMNTSKYINYICKVIAYEMDCYECFGLEDGYEYGHDPDTDFKVDVIHYDILPKEHKWYSFSIMTDRGITHEIVRHRKLSYSQESTRYVNYGGSNMKFILPRDLSFGEEEIVIRTCKLLEDTYNALIEYGVKPQQARDILPTCLKTELIVTGLVEDLEWFVELRSANGAHPKIRTIAEMIRHLIDM